MDHYNLVLNLSNHMHPITKRFQTFFKDQLDRSKATCPSYDACHCDVETPIGAVRPWRYQQLYKNPDHAIIVGFQ